MAQDNIGAFEATANRFTVGGVLGTSFAVLMRNLAPFGIISLFLGIPYLLLGLWIDTLPLSAPDGTANFTRIWAGLLTFLVSLLTSALIQSALTFGTIQDLRGQRASLGDCIMRGISILPKVLIAAVLASIALGFATLLLIIPGIILFVMWWVYVPTIVVEGAGIGEAFARSRVLTKGCRWQIFGLLLIAGLALWVISIAVIMILAASGVAIGSWLQVLLSLVFSMFSAVMTAVGYYYLRAEKEGVAIDDIAKVFD